MYKFSLLIFTVLSISVNGLEIKSFDEKIKPFLEKYCIDCHGAKKKKAGISFVGLNGEISDTVSAQLYQDTVDVLNTADMPPEDEMQPEPEELENFISSLSQDVANASKELSGSLSSNIRRLNKREYRNIIKDKMGVHLRTETVLDELYDHGFDTFSKNLGVSRANLETNLTNGRIAVSRFISLAEEQRDVIEFPLKLTKVKGNKLIHHGKPPKVVDGEYQLELVVYSKSKRNYFIRHSVYPESYLVYGSKDKPQTIRHPFTHFSLASNKHVLVPSEIYNSNYKRGDLVIQKIGVTGKVSNKQAKKFFRPWMNHLKENKAFSSAYFKDIVQSFSKMMCRGESVEPAFLDYLTKLYFRELESSKNAKAALVEPLALILSSPKFLYIPASNSLSNREYLNRVSLFFWSSAPDDIATRGMSHLHNKTYLDIEVDRFLSSPKADRFFRHFNYQWFELDKFDEIAVNEKLYPKFNESIRSSLKQEAFHFLKKLIQTNQPITKLVDSNFIMADPIVAKHYGIEGKASNEFVELKLPEGSPYGGLLTSPAIMSLTSTGVRTSPVERGAFILRKFLDQPPLPAPANVPQLDAISTKGLTAKEILANHTRTPQCASCHRKMDSLGFALEKFDALGKIRTIEKRLVSDKQIDEVSIDSSGVFAGEEIMGHESLKAYLVKNQEILAQSYVKALLSYGLGRELGFADKAGVAAILEENREGGFRMKDLIVSVVNSKLFKSK